MRITIGRTLAVAAGVAALLVMLRPTAFQAQLAPRLPAQPIPEIPAWLFPSPPAGAAPVWDSIASIRLPRSRSAFTERQLHDLFSAPDWTPTTHPPMPTVVATGRRPGVFACAYCHMPDGAGRPENVMLAGLPAAYIVQQVADMKSRARHAVSPGPWVPSDVMFMLAGQVSDEEVAASAAYFARLTPRQRTAVKEAVRIPRVLPTMGTFRYAPGQATELLNGRVIEVPVDFERHEYRDPAVGYIAYVPVGSVARGRRLADAPIAAGLLTCAGCHGPQLRGVGVIPPIAGRSPAYLIRQLLAFKSGARTTPAGAAMRPVASAMSLRDMIAVASYAATLTP